MTELNITGDLTVEEIHKIREYNYEKTKQMTACERIAYYHNGAEEMKQLLLKRKRQTSR